MRGFAERNPKGHSTVQGRMDDGIDREALEDAGLDPEDPEVWKQQYRISDMLRCYEIWLQS